ncbi:reverse transcriptase (RNA-dependent DNA polymerase) domain-containing protein [Rhizophagus clarus]|uniref:Reverse transcriptase (RNA-dependent DNA polymerase) domain-containing protein n=2 Tax=Rhizophagus clarus TaxID=94130 RepID=A0A8H3LE90_9GLOM|nr:reverse transcriptase (RNA-dependent DNA polymerase) domain-containing protein [Rhizophagus clarus]
MSGNQGQGHSYPSGSASQPISAPTGLNMTDMLAFNPHHPLNQQQLPPANNPPPTNTDNNNNQGGGDDDEMEGLADHLDAAIDLTSPDYLNLANVFGKVHELACTRAMKTRVKNLVSKLARLQKRLIFLSSMASMEGVDQEGGDDAAAAIFNMPNVGRRKYKIGEIRKNFQFRLVDVPSVRKNTLEVLQTNIALVTWSALYQDCNSDITDTTAAITACPGKLNKELEDAAVAALNSSLLNDTEKNKLTLWWVYLKQFNNRLFNLHVTKCKTGMVSTNRNNCNNLIIEVLTNCVRNSSLVMMTNPSTILDQSPHEQISQGTNSCQAEHSKTQGSPKQRRQKRRRTVKKTKGKEGTGHRQQDEGSCQKSGTKTKRPQTGQKKVFVNTFLPERNITIPSYVFRTLNLGANFQLCSIPSFQTIQKGWETSARQIQEAINKREEQGLISSNLAYINNLMNALNDQRFCNVKFINKVTHNKALRKAANINLSLQRVYDFIRDNKLLVILADKNLGLTIVDKDWYHEHMQKHITNTSYFEELDINDTTAGVVRIVDGDLDWKPFFTKWEYNLRKLVKERYGKAQAGRDFMDAYFDWDAAVFPQPYGLIKLHKQPPKLRYITPVVGWMNKKVAVYVVGFLQPYVEKCKWILASSTQLINLVEADISNRLLVSQNKSLWVGTFDVQDMYNQIDYREALQIIYDFAKEEGWVDSKNKKHWNFVLNLVHWVCQTAYITYDGHFYKQIRGLPMGSPLSPVIANLFMAGVEDKATKALESYYETVSTTLAYYRYLDDIIIIATSHTVRIDDSEGCSPLEEDAGALLCEISKAVVESSIAFDYTGDAWRNGESVEYLDLRLMVNSRNGKKWLTTSVFDKPTNLHIYTDPSTWYPMSYVYNWIQGENIRYIRNSSSPQVYRESLDLFKEFLFRRNFLDRKIEAQLQLNSWADRQALLRGEKPHKDRKGKGKDTRQNTYVLIDNSGCRDVITSSVKAIDNIAREFVPELDLRFAPVVKKGKNILSVMNTLRKH